jgi:hypothetical protein
MRGLAVRGLLFGSRAAALATVTAGAAAAATPTRDVIPPAADIVFIGQCDFPVLAHLDGSEILTPFVNKADETIKQIGVFPANRLTLTNLDTGRSLRLPATGQFHVQMKRDGTGFALVTGHGPNVPHPITGEPGIWYLSGRLNATLDTDGNPVSVRSSGRLVNLCAQLAG